MSSTWRFKRLNTSSVSSTRGVICQPTRRWVVSDEGRAHAVVLDQRAGAQVAPLQAGRPRTEVACTWRRCWPPVHGVGNAARRWRSARASRPGRHRTAMAAGVQRLFHSTPRRAAGGAGLGGARRRRCRPARSRSPASTTPAELCRPGHRTRCARPLPSRALATSGGTLSTASPVFGSMRGGGAARIVAVQAATGVDRRNSVFAPGSGDQAELGRQLVVVGTAGVRPALTGCHAVERGPWSAAHANDAAQPGRQLDAALAVQAELVSRTLSSRVVAMI
jgi:hypothetical protein